MSSPNHHHERVPTKRQGDRKDVVFSHIRQQNRKESNGSSVRFPRNRMGLSSNYNEQRQSKFGLEDRHGASRWSLSQKSKGGPPRFTSSHVGPKDQSVHSILWWVRYVRNNEQPTNQPCKEMESSAILGRLVLPTCHFLLKTHPCNIVPARTPVYT